MNTNAAAMCVETPNAVGRVCSLTNSNRRNPPATSFFHAAERADLQPGLAEFCLRPEVPTEDFPSSTLLAFSAKRTCASYLRSTKGLAPSRNPLIPLPAITKGSRTNETIPPKRRIFLDSFLQT